MSIRRCAAVLCCFLGVGCADDPSATDAQTVGDRYEDATDASAVTDRLADASVPTADGPAGLDAVTVDSGATPLDTGLTDVPSSDAGAVDGMAFDRHAADVSLSDVPAVDVPRDVPGVDLPGVDGSCLGTAPVFSVTAPTRDEVIETCTAAGLPVFYDFAAAVTASSPVLRVSARWITPGGVEAPPPAMLSAAPYVFHRLVGGSSAGIPALSVFGIRGTWRVEFTAIDACGRSTTAAQTFTLTFTTRRCPNP